MDINSILKGVACECGKTHTCDIEAVYIESGAIRRLTKLCDPYQDILIVADENTFGAAGKQVVSALKDKAVRKVLFSGKTVVIPNEDAIAVVERDLGDADLIISIGSGVLQDLCKYISHKHQVPYMVVATAPSMDGYASTGAAMILKGMKETVASGLPRAIIADTKVLKDAPMEMIQAGYGDIIGKYSSLCDWKLAHIVNDETLCPYIYTITYQMIEAVIGTAKGLLTRDEKSVGALMEALVIVGIMMSFAGSSRPASGSEHHLSHFFEIVGIINDEPYFAHGIDVVYSTVITAQVREELLKKPFPDRIFRLSPDAYKAKMQEVYSVLAPECMALQERMGNYTDRLAVYKAKEPQIRKVLTEMPTVERILELLGLVELDISDFYALYGKEKIQTAVAYAKDLKDRYTVLWLYYDLFGGVLDVREH